ncbi:hypothetical protein NMG60_11001035 [Bertholletia excelsa]
MNDPRAANTSRVQDQLYHHDDHHEVFRDIHALTPPLPPPPTPTTSHRGRRDTLESFISSSLAMANTEGASTDNFASVSREFSALVLAGSTLGSTGEDHEDNGTGNGNNLRRIGEEAEEAAEETNPLAIVPDTSPLDPPPPSRRASNGGPLITGNHSEVSVQRVKKEEVETKISAWQTAKVAKINNRFKREDAIISGWEGEQVQKATSALKKVERKLEEKRVRALEKMQNEVAKAHRKAEERKASAEARRGTKVARILEVANLMRAVGRAPAKRSIF